MNKLECKLLNRFYIDNFETSINNVKISFFNIEGNLKVELVGKKGCDKLFDLFLEIYDMMFLLQGFYPILKEITENNFPKDISNLIGKYTTSSHFVRLSNRILNINNISINQQTYNSFKNINGAYLYSFEYVVSDVYKGITSNHKIMIMLHCLEGYIVNSKYSNLTNTVPSKIKNRFNRRIYFILKELFFYNSKYKCELLKLLKTSKFKMISLLADTRNENSHYIKHTFTIDRGDLMIYYFYILYYTFRLFLIKEIGLKPNESFIKNFYYEIHDWLNKNIYDSKYEYKSTIYKIKEYRK